MVVWETDYKKNKNIILEIIKNYEKNWNENHPSQSQDKGISST